MDKFCAVILILTILFVGCSPPPPSYSAIQIRISVDESKVADWCECDVLAWTTNVETKGTATFCHEGLCIVSEQEPEYGKLHILILPKGIESLTIELEDRDGLKITWHP
jgi:hypothetical protein